MKFIFFIFVILKSVFSWWSSHFIFVASYVAIEEGDYDIKQIIGLHFIWNLLFLLKGSINFSDLMQHMTSLRCI